MKTNPMKRLMDIINRDFSDKPDDAVLLQAVSPIREFIGIQASPALTVGDVREAFRLCEEQLSTAPLHRETGGDKLSMAATVEEGTARNS